MTFVENARGALDSLERNLETFKRNQEVNCNFSIVCDDVARQLRKLAGPGESFSLIFADPPYGAAAQELLLNASLSGLLTDGGTLVLESAKREALTVNGPWELARESVYGDTRVSFLQTKQMA